MSNNNEIKAYIEEILENEHYMGLYDIEKIFETYDNIKENFREKQIENNFNIEDFTEGYFCDLENQQVLEHLNLFPEDREK